MTTHLLVRRQLRDFDPLRTFPLRFNLSAFAKQPTPVRRRTIERQMRALAEPRAVIAS